MSAAFSDPEAYPTPSLQKLDAEEFSFVTAPRIRSHAGMHHSTYKAVFHDRDGDIEIHVTEPAIEADPDLEFPLIMTIPGCSETPSAGACKEVAKDLSDYLPGSRIVTVANDGLNKYGKKYSAYDMLTRSLPDSAAARLRLCRALAGKTALALVGESMGTVIGLHLLDLNQRSGYGNLEIGEAVMHNEALVTPDKTFTAMGLRFMPHIISNTIHETVTHPVQTVACWQPRVDLLQPRKWLALAGQVGALLPGTRAEVLERVVADDTTKIGFQGGLKDALRQERMLKYLAAQYPETVIVDEYNDGHASSLRHRETAHRISGLLHRLYDLHEQPIITT